MTPKCSTCPVDGECRSYPHLCAKVAADPARHRTILDRLNGTTAAAATAEDEKLRAYLENRPCGC